MARVSSTCAGTTRAIRTLGVAGFDFGGGPRTVVFSRLDHHVSVAGLKSRFAQNSDAVCPLRFHAATRSAQISAVVMARSVKPFAQVGPTAP